MLAAFAWLNNYGQIKKFDILIPDPDAALGVKNIFETDSSYVLFTQKNIAPVFTNAVQIFTIRKKDGKIIREAFLRKGDFDLLYMQSNSVIIERISHLRFLGNLYDKLYEFDYDYKANILIIGDSITHPLGGGYYDFQHIKVEDTTYYHVQSYNPDDSYMPAIIKKTPDSLSFILMDTIPNFDRIGRHMELLPNQNYLIFGSEISKLLSPNFLSIIEMDRNGKVVSKVLNSELDNCFQTSSVVKVNEDEYLVLANSFYYNAAEEARFFYFTVYRYNHKTKKLVWKYKDNKYASPIFASDGYIIKGHTPNEYLFCSEAYCEKPTADSSFSRGHIVKIKDDGNIIWSKYYYYTSNRGDKNRFNHIIATQDGHYLAAGTSTPIGFSAWAIKIDEEGNIIPIDTSTSIPLIAIPEIKIYPNPASDYIIINQSEATDMHYTLYDVQGRLIKKLVINEAHQHTMWDISNVERGIYFLEVRCGQKRIRSEKMVVE